TGRTHQIRVHLEAVNHPVAGDPVYGRRPQPLGLERQFLHASRLSLPHPETGEPLVVESPLPADLDAALDRARALASAPARQTFRPLGKPSTTRRAPPDGGAEASSPVPSAPRRLRDAGRTNGGAAVSAVTMKQLLESGVHFGHQTRRWNPKMKRYIFGERGGIYIIDLTQTLDLLGQAVDVSRDIAARNGTVMVVGTKKQCQDAVRDQAPRARMRYVAHRWLGGLL